MRISVVIPTYNRADLVGRAVESVVSQTHPAAEIIVVDDGSKDGTGELAKKWSAPVRYLRQENQGVSTARNYGVEQAQGDWVAFLDSDDEWLPHKLADQAAVLQAHPELAWCCSRFLFVPTEGGPATSSLLLRADRRELGRYGYFRSFFHPRVRYYLFRTSTLIVRRDAFLSVGGFNRELRYMEDFEMWARIAMQFPAFGYAEREGLRYFVNSSLSLTQAPERQRDVRNVLESLLSHAGTASPDVRRAVERWAGFRAFNYYAMFASGRRTIEPNELRQWRELCRPGAMARCGLGFIRLMPRRFAKSAEVLLREFAYRMELYA